MEEARDRGLEKIYGSDTVATLYDTIVALDISPQAVMKDFAWWLDNIDNLDVKAAEMRERGENVTAEAIRKQLG